MLDLSHCSTKHEVKEWAKINGYDAKGAEKIAADWENKPVEEPSAPDFGVEIS